MGRRREAARTHVRVPKFVNDDLNELVNVLTDRAKAQVPRPKVLGALVLAARQLPPEVVEALFPAYDERASQEPPSTG
jgi:hypothetical protein